MTQTPEDAATFCSSEYPRLVGGLSLYTGAGSWPRSLRRLAGRAGPDRREPEIPGGTRVMEAVAALASRQRVAMLLRHYLDLSVAETAERMGISEDAVRSLTKRATSRLREELEATRTLEHPDG